MRLLSRPAEKQVDLFVGQTVEMGFHVTCEGGFYAVRDPHRRLVKCFEAGARGENHAWAWSAAANEGLEWAKANLPSCHRQEVEP